MDWEQWLRTAAQKSSKTEESDAERTRTQILEALSDYEPLNGRFRTYVKGSYANNTNVRLNYDVDIAVEYLGYAYYDLSFDLEGQSGVEVGIVDSDDPYTREDFKQDIRRALEIAFGRSAVKTGRIAYRIREAKTTLPADVVPCWEYRRYDGYRNGALYYNKGSRVYPSDGGHVDNFPEIQLEEGVAKNLNTGRRYKRMVRALKKIQTRLVAAGKLDTELASYLTECVVFNVPDPGFNHRDSYYADMQAVLAHVFNGTLLDGDYDEWVEVHGLKYLFRGSRDWSRTQVHRMAGAAWDHLGF